MVMVTGNRSKMAPLITQQPPRVFSHDNSMLSPTFSSNKATACPTINGKILPAKGGSGLEGYLDTKWRLWKQLAEEMFL